LRLADVVLLYGHRVGYAVLQHTLQRRAQVLYAGGSWIVGIVGKDVEDSPAENLLALRHRRAKVRVADGDDGQVRGQNQVQARR